ncbi:MAG: tetraacyldisaccharide 4'-kinase [Bacteroidales bacterium]
MICKKKNIIYPLYPLSILYGWGISFRNALFNLGILPSRSFKTPVICVGNLTVGGTGKTPHIEYLIRQLSPQYRIAVLSRGYKRKSKGFILADHDSTPEQLGDEPYQLKKKFPHINVAVDVDRRNGITRLESISLPPEVILLDDAMQHRYVTPGLTILLTDYNRPYYEDILLPAGRLREGKNGVRRADIIIVSKNPGNLSPEESARIEIAINPNKQQEVFFSTLEYLPLRKVSNDKKQELPAETDILLVTGIARPELIEKQISTRFRLYESLNFADHHEFSKSDIEKITLKFNEIKNKQKAIIVTEKDAVRLQHNEHLSNYLKENIYYLPLEIVFLHHKTKSFNQTILNYVAENQRNS